MKRIKKKRILIAPLNWGIGHATRMIPIIKEFIKQGSEVVIAAEGFPAELLKEKFPDLEHIEFQGFEVQYAAEKEGFIWKMFLQFPKLLRGIYTEHKELQKIIQKHSIDAVISDNRFGLFSKRIPSVFITHQLFIKMPRKFSFLSSVVDFINRLFYSQYQEVWSPDLKGMFNLSGDLSHKHILPDIKFLGALSRFSERSSSNLVKSQEKSQKFDLLISLSGPEPQRTILEKKIIKQLLETNYTAVLLQGKPGQKKAPNPSSKITLLPHANDTDFLSYIENSKLLISRSGYSTIMDLFVLGKKAVFIPTPGQTEQEYLSERFKRKKICNSFSQEEFDIELAFKEDGEYSGFDKNEVKCFYPEVIREFLEKV